jgi:NAD(P)-dependent dehydrogenase (short-subunit alcohol dehydrogenase family)
VPKKRGGEKERVAGNLFDLSGKVAVITGGNSGLGLGFARGIARMGGAVEIWGRAAERNESARAELESLGARASARQVDVSSEEAIIAGFDAVMKTYGRIDCVIANAGLPPPRSSDTMAVSTEEFRSFLEISFFGAYFTLREGARHMIARAEAGEPGGSLVFCGSLSIYQGLPGKGAYAGAKAGMGAIVRSLAVELGKYGIRANTVAPGYTKTGMTGGSDELTPVDQYFASKTPIPRPGYPADFEGIAAYLASDASSFHSGDTIVIDGAALINM